MTDTEPAPRRPGRPAQLSREQIVDAVTSVDNVDTLTMRELATRLNVRHGALYRWVKNRDELFDLISEVVVERILDSLPPPRRSWRPRLALIAHAMHDEFLALPGYATHLARPHPHNAHSTGRLRQAVVDTFVAAGIDVQTAQRSWYVFINTVIGWLAYLEQPAEPDAERPSFDLFLDVLLRGLPVR